MFPVLKWRPVVTEGDSEARKGQITIRFKLIFKSSSSISTPHSQLRSELGSPCLWPEWSSSSSLRDVSVRPHSGRQDHLQQHFCQIQDQNTTILSSPVDDTEEHGATHKPPTPGRIWNVSVIVSKIVMPGFDIKSWSIDVVMSIFCNQSNHRSLALTALPLSPTKSMDSKTTSRRWALHCSHSSLLSVL